MSFSIPLDTKLDAYHKGYQDLVSTTYDDRIAMLEELKQKEE